MQSFYKNKKRPSAKSWISKRLNSPKNDNWFCHPVSFSLRPSVLLILTDRWEWDLSLEHHSPARVCSVSWRQILASLIFEITQHISYSPPLSTLPFRPPYVDRLFTIYSNPTGKSKQAFLQQSIRNADGKENLCFSQKLGRVWLSKLHNKSTTPVECSLLVWRNIKRCCHFKTSATNFSATRLALISELTSTILTTTTGTTGTTGTTTIIVYT